jgi:hypothetical protein
MSTVNATNNASRIIASIKNVNHYFHSFNLCATNLLYMFPNAMNYNHQFQKNLSIGAMSCIASAMRTAFQVIVIPSEIFATINHQMNAIKLNM